MLPEPALILTLPSLHDSLVLDCRVYHPLSLAANPRAPPWLRHAAIVAHPYAPMGGSYDDPVVETVAAQLLRKGFLVGTFNFRGGGNSAGRTSWTSKPERDDYATFVGFMVHYVHYLDPFHQRTDQQPYDSRGVFVSAPTSAPITPKPNDRPVLILAGYSYGAMITTHLPPLDSILQRFVSPDPDSDAGQIRLRAQHLAEQQNLVLGSARVSILERGTPRSSSKRGVRIGGDEGGSPRKSHDSHHRRSFSLDAEDRLRRGVHELVAKARSGRHGQRLFSSEMKRPIEPENPPPDEPMAKISDLIMPRPAYLVVSPLQGLVTHLATVSLMPSALVRNKAPEDVAAEEKLVRNPTLAIYGDNDVFVGANKLRAWKERLVKRQGSQFRGEEISSAGHFWIEEGVLDRMRHLVGEFGDKLLGVNGV
ncbi:Fc.00g054510.m01.CDS01 [Cosmosporella sp. VM-42]